MKKQPKVVVISGASSGIGATLAQQYANSDVILYLIARNEVRLKEIARLCEEKGAQVHVMSLDVTDAASMEHALQSIDKQYPVDILIANAGISAGSGFGGESPAQARTIFNVNIIGVVNTVLPLLPAMMARKSGHIAVISSIAGLRGLPSAPAYSASKAGVLAYTDALRGFALKSGVKVTAVCPGYIRTPMTDKNQFPMPFIMSVEKAAARMIRGIEKGQKRLIFPWPLRIGLAVVNAVPLALADRLLAVLPTKDAV